ncbi:C6 transcription factor [Pochonia chlamydosporia 170]|uniref:C6 transcription factor n=1 Tax=Pochonia chlamydosporia 170 TaxID=1380566 RepID=A0A179FJJ2_METCM|nr:C6 transcription factor [Pochonia chlamydosporia 170]OAQ65193.1 C6 transcription factor [Pochonia chlamydosporia 170]
MANNYAKALKALHVPSKPIVFANIWDIPSLNAISTLNTPSSKLVQGVATASWAIAAANGVQDEELTAEQNLEAIKRIAPFAAKAGLPISTDLQDGYGSRIADIVTQVVKAGVAGANIEDSIPSAGFGKGISGSLYSVEEQVQRLKTALKAAADAGTPDFVLNARCDIFCLENDIDDDTRVKEAIKRGKAYLELGATTVFYWGGPRGGMTRQHLETLVKELDGRVAVLFSAYPGVKSTTELAELGVARVSIGPGLFRVAMGAVKAAAENMLTGGTLAP